MEFARPSTTERAVSPVIGIVLIVAITVILSAVIGTFALGVGESQDTAPQSSWKTDYTSGSPDELTLTHDSGDRMEADRLSIIITGSNHDGKYSFSTLGVTGEVSAGTEVTVDDTVGTNLDLSSATVRLVWEDEDIDDQADSAVLVVWEGPDA
jgi:flagellin-like protein